MQPLNHSIRLDPIRIIYSLLELKVSLMEFVYVRTLLDRSRSFTAVLSCHIMHMFLIKRTYNGVSKGFTCVLKDKR